jgi:hypothetical protein
MASGRTFGIKGTLGFEGGLDVGDFLLGFGVVSAKLQIEFALPGS